MGVSIPKPGRKTASTGAKLWAATQLIQRAATDTGTRTSKKTVALVGAAATTAGGAAVYFFDPEQGARRRSVAIDRAGALLRRGQREAVSRADYAAGQAKGVVHEATPDAPKPELTDQDLARKVESVIFRDADVPKGQINVDAVGRRVTLRGEAAEDMIERLVTQTHEIPEVERVENLLHVPGSPAATRADTEAASEGGSSSNGPEPEAKPKRRSTKK